jgi:dihydropteroate synthase
MGSNDKELTPLKVQVLDCGGILLDLSMPAVMGILNITPDSFYDGGTFPTVADQLKQTEKMLSDGASVIDIGGVSTRPGSATVSEEEETARILPLLSVFRRYFPGSILSVDTFRSSVARLAIDNGAGMINDIYAGRFDEKIMETVASSGIPYIMMHMQGTPATMQHAPSYKDVVLEVKQFFRKRLSLLPPGFDEVILDPGFGFGKNVEHNYTLLAHLEDLREEGYPVMAGLSRKSMITKALDVKPASALNGTTVLNTVALLKGANILRVHDVKEAVEAVRLMERIRL